MEHKRYWDSEGLREVDSSLKPFECSDILDLMGRRFLSHQVTKEVVQSIIKEVKGEL